MLLKKPTIALCSSGSLSSTLSLPASAAPSNGCASLTSSTSTWTPTPARPRARPLRISTRWQGVRPYATVYQEEPRSNAHEGPHIPDPKLPAWPKATHPTPYEIFDQAKSAPYSKKTFYSLVKLYHPDLHAHAHAHPRAVSHLPHAAKLERYRLVVAANTILSDPAKRRAYDLYGAGWSGTSDMSNASYREMDRAWRQQPGSAAGNATWEDWERWHEQHSGRAGGFKEKQQPLYMSNGLFVMTLAVFVIIGGWGQATRAGNHSVQLIEMRESSSQSISEEMWRRRAEKAVLNREDRIRSFLEQRESSWGRGPSSDSDSHVPKD